jgi:hypothetical protein
MKRGKSKTVSIRSQKRAPTEAEQEQLAVALDRHAGRGYRVKAECEGDELVAPHSDTQGHLITLLDALGTKSAAFLATNLGKLEAATRERFTKRGDNGSGLNAGLAMVQAIAPENELEAALAIQMAGTHSLAVEMLGSAKITENTQHLQLYGNLAIKLERTFVAQIEALARLRGKGQQTVRVEHVTVESGAQAIVGDVHHHRPGGRGMRRKMGFNPMNKSRSNLPMHQSPRCRARTRRGTECLCPAMKNGRCRLHGGPNPGAPKGNKNRLTHGFYSADSIASRREAARLLRMWRERDKSIV